MTTPYKYKINWWRTQLGEEEIRRLTEAVRQEHLSLGPVTADFEQRLSRLLGGPYVVATTSGSMAILMGCLAAGVGPGDEVIVPNRTWIATAHAPFLLGARPVFVDVLPDRPILDVNQIEARLTPRTKAILPVHLNGRSADMPALRQLAQKHGLHIVEDAAQALGSRNADGFLGTQSLAGCFSLSVAKIITTGQGGYVVTRDPDVAAQLRSMRTQGVSDVLHATFAVPGFNFRFTDLQASVGLAQLDRFEDRVRKVKAVYQRYAAGLAGLTRVRLLPADLSREIPIYIEVLCPNRDRLVQSLAEQGIQTRPFYPDLHTAPHFHDTGHYPNSDVFARQGLFLPSGPDQPLENVDQVIEQVREFDLASG